MNKVTLKWLKGCDPSNNPYNTSGAPIFSWVATDGSKKEFRQISTNHGCRETFTNVIHKKLFDEKCPVQDVNLKKMDFSVVKKHDKFTLVGNDKTRSDEVMKVAMNCVHIIEKYLGWSMSRIYEIENGNMSENNAYGYIIRGSRKWLRSPPILSLYLLIVKMAEYKETMSKVKTIYDFEVIGSLPEFSNNTNAKLANPFVVDGENSSIFWYRAVCKQIVPFIENIHNLFFKNSLKQNYKLFSCGDGISSFCNNKINVPSIEKKWSKILKERKSNGKQSK